jgi:FtsH-binding integral membrane protein
MEENMDNRYPQNERAIPQVPATEASTIFLAKVFNWMAIGLGLTGVIAFLTINSQTALQMLFTVQDGYAKPNMLLYGLLIAELGLVFYLSARVQKISAQAATGIFLGYSALNGVTLSTILLYYTASSVAATFFVTAGMFGAMAVYGFVTKKDLSSWGSFLFMGLIGIIIASVVNIFLGSSMMSWVISGIGVIIFTGLTAYDVQQITRMGEQGIMNGGEAAIRKGAIMGALKLYLDFINLFLMLLRFMGDRR